MPKKYYSVTISFKPDTFHLYEYLKTKDNMSAYILRLIREDMNHDKTGVSKEEITKILLEVLNGSDITNSSYKNNITEETFNDHDISIINDYF